MHGKIAEGQVTLGRYHSIVDHLVNLRIITKECHNNKIDLFCGFVEFRKSFDIIPIIRVTVTR